MKRYVIWPSPYFGVTLCLKCSSAAAIFGIPYFIKIEKTQPDEHNTNTGFEDMEGNTCPKMQEGSPQILQPYKY